MIHQFSSHPTTTKRLLRGAFLLGALTVLACGDSETDPDPSPNDPGTPEPEVPNPEPPDPNDDPLFAICGALFNPEGPSGYLALAQSLDSSTTVDVRNVIEFGGGATCAALEGTSTVYVGIAESPEIQRWELDEDGDPSVTGRMSLAGEGFSSAFRSRNPIQLINESKAYFISSEGVVIWDPTEMIIVDSFPLSGLDATDLAMSLSFPLRDGNRIVLAAWYRRPDRSLEPRAQLVFIDVTTDAVSYSPVDTRCSVDWPAVAENGDIYFASPADQGINVAFGLAGDPAAVPCVLRLNAGETEFDPTFLLDPQQIVESRFAGALADGAGALAFTLSYDESLFPLDETLALQAIGLPAWRYNSFTLPDAPGGATPVDTLPPGAGLPWFNVVDGVPYAFVYDAEIGRAQLFDISDPNAARAGADVPGLPLQAIRVN